LFRRPIASDVSPHPTAAGEAAARILPETAAELAEAVDGVDWDAAKVTECGRRLSRGAAHASPEQLTAALAVLVARLDRSRVEDADGVAQVAISAGALVERGAPPPPLGEVLLRKLPEVLVAARRFADTCIARMGPATEEEDESPEEDVAAHVDGRPIPHALFRELLAEDRGGGAALAYLRQWTLPTVATLTRDRNLLLAATRHAGLGAAAKALSDSDAVWLHALTGVELDAPWLALFPALDRGFRLTVDGVAANFDLHALVADVLIERGVEGRRNPRDVMAVLRGEADACSANGVLGSWNLYSFGAAAYDVRVPDEVPQEHWVWGEGQPRDVPVVEGMRTLIIGPPAYARGWGTGRMFEALRPRVEVDTELSESEVRETLKRLRALAPPPVIDSTAQ
jgi:hypothetical protein